MPNPRTFGSQVVQIGKETVENTPVAALKRLTGLSINLKPDVGTRTFRPAGYRRPTLVTPGKKMTSISADGQPTYSELPYILSGVYKDAAISTPGGGTNSRDWLFAQSSSVSHPVPTFTIEKGSAQGAERATGCFLSGYSISGDPDGVQITAEGQGRLLDHENIAMSTREVQTVDLSGDADPTGGTWTLTILGVTTGNLAFDISAAALQTAINALNADGAIDVTVTKAGFVYTITYPFYLGNVASVTVDSTLLTSGGSVSVTIATTTPGVAASEVELRPILPEHVSWYANEASGDIGTTQLTKVLRYSISDTGMRAGYHTVNRSNAGNINGKVDQPEPAGEITLLVEADDAGMAFYEYAKEGTIVFLRFEAIDDADSIETGFEYEAVFDFAAAVSSVGDFTDDQGLYAIEFTLTIEHSAAWAKAMSVRVRNALTAL